MRGLILQLTLCLIALSSLVFAAAVERVQSSGTDSTGGQPAHIRRILHASGENENSEALPWGLADVIAGIAPAHGANLPEVAPWAVTAPAKDPAKDPADTDTDTGGAIGEVADDPDSIYIDEGPEIDTFALEYPNYDGRKWDPPAWRNSTNWPDVWLAPPRVMNRCLARNRIITKEWDITIARDSWSRPGQCLSAFEHPLIHAGSYGKEWSPKCKVFVVPDEATGEERLWTIAHAHIRTGRFFSDWKMTEAIREASGGNLTIHCHTLNDSPDNPLGVVLPDPTVKFPMMEINWDEVHIDGTGRQGKWLNWQPQ